jgi:hypothetical protein
LEGTVRERQRQEERGETGREAETGRERRLVGADEKYLTNSLTRVLPFQRERGLEETSQTPMQLPTSISCINVIRRSRAIGNQRVKDTGRHAAWHAFMQAGRRTGGGLPAGDKGSRRAVRRVSAAALPQSPCIPYSPSYIHKLFATLVCRRKDFGLAREKEERVGARSGMREEMA